MPDRRVMVAVSGAARIAAARTLPIGLWKRLAPRSTFGVCYHMVSSEKLRHLKHYPPLAPQPFEVDVDFLERSFRVLTYDEALQRRSAPHVVRDNTSMLTFDDGFAQCATVVAPILRRHGRAATFFVVTDLIDNRVMFRESQASLCIDAISRRPADDVLGCLEGLASETGLPWLSGPPRRPAGFDPHLADLGSQIDPRLTSLVHGLLAARPEDLGLLDALSDLLGVDVDGYLQSVRPYLTTEQILQLHSDGFTIGAHSRSHPKLQELSREEAAAEIVESCRIIRDLTGQPSVPFAFPYSGWGLDRTWLAGLRREHDFIGLFFDTGGLRADAPFVVHRVFGERVTGARPMDRILREAWAQSI